MIPLDDAFFFQVRLELCGCASLFLCFSPFFFFLRGGFVLSCFLCFLTGRLVLASSATFASAGVVLRAKVGCAVIVPAELSGEPRATPWFLANNTQFLGSGSGRQLKAVHPIVTRQASQQPCLKGARTHAASMCGRLKAQEWTGCGYAPWVGEMIGRGGGEAQLFTVGGANAQGARTMFHGGEWVHMRAPFGTHAFKKIGGLHFARARCAHCAPVEVCCRQNETARLVGSLAPLGHLFGLRSTRGRLPRLYIGGCCGGGSWAGILLCSGCLGACGQKQPRGFRPVSSVAVRQDHARTCTRSCSPCHPGPYPSAAWGRAASACARCQS